MRNWIVILILVLGSCRHGKQPTVVDIMRVDSANISLPAIDSSLLLITTDSAIAIVDLPTEKPVAIPIIIEQHDPLSIRQRVIEIYTSQVGVREKTGKNDGKEVEAYLKTVGLGKGYAWCAAYVKYCLIKGGSERAKAITGAAASVHNTKRFVYFNRRFLAEPKVGDAFTLYYSKLGRIGHTGFFDGWTDRSMGAYRTKEGNTNGGGSRDGDGVYQRIRQLGGTYSLNNWID